jgi:DNA-binding response OmpR family regulator
MSADTAPPLILVVEDDDFTRDSIVRSLHAGGFRTQCCLQRADILAEIAEGSCAALLLDLGLPGDDGVSIATEVRAGFGIPILMLTGRVGIHERVRGLEAGADDYLLKPFARDELVARLRAALRRAAMPPAADRLRIEVAAQIGDARLVLATRALTGPLGAQRLTEREARLLVALCHSGGPLSRPKSYRVLFQRDWDPLDRSLDVHVSNLRRKLQAVSTHPGIVATLRGQGYELRVPSSVEMSDVAP